MKKIITLVAVFVAVLSLAGCVKKNQSINQDSSKAVQYSTLMDWLKSGKGVECVIQTPFGEVRVNTKDKKVRIDGIAYADMANPASAGQTKAGTSLTDGEWVYMWSGNSGMKMNIEEMNKLSKETGSGDKVDPKDYSWEAWVSDQESAGENYQCSEQNFSDSVFEAPSDVEFKDLGQMMKGVNNMSNSLMNGSGDTSANNEAPGFEGSQNMTQEQIEARLEEMMKNQGVK